MRYLVGFVFVLGLAASPLSLGAQDLAAPVEQPAWHAKLEVNRVGYAEDLKLRTRAERSRVALAVSAVPLALGLITVGVSYADFCMYGFFGCEGDECCSQIGNPTRTIGAGLMLSGVVWAAVAGTVFGVSKRKIREQRAPYYGTRRRAQWDLGRSRLVF